MSVGQAYSDILTPRAQEALEMGCNWIIDHCFENYNDLKDPEHFEDTILGKHLPSRYLHRYTPLLYKQFAVCIITVAWKLAQPKHMPLSSVAEELAAWAIINQAKALTEEDKDGEAIEKVLEKFIDEYFEDLDLSFYSITPMMVLKKAKRFRSWVCLPWLLMIGLSRFLMSLAG
jgi:hypothetical protein